MKNYENLIGTKLLNNLTALYFFEIAKAIPKKICLASYLLAAFFKRNQFIKPTLNKLFLFFFITFLISCDQNKSPFYDEILKSEAGQLRGVEINSTIKALKKIENDQFLKDQMPNYLHYDYEISMGNTYTVTYDFSEDNELYEIEVAVFLDVIEDVEVLFNNFSDFFNRKYSIGRKEDDGYLTWQTKSTISNSRVTISMINDSEAYGYLTILVRNLDY